MRLVANLPFCIANSEVRGNSERWMRMLFTGKNETLKKFYCIISGAVSVGGFECFSSIDINYSRPGLAWWTW